MTIDERLEALTQTVELTAAMHRDNERAYEERSRATDQRLREIMESINALARIAGLHQDRLDDHGDRLDNLERH